MLFLLQPLPPISSFSTSRRRVEPSFAAHDNARCRGKFHVASARSEDDYHATLKALKSRGLTPRKSLGQDPHMALHVRERFSSIDQLTVLQEDFTRCHIRSHMISLLQNAKSSGRNSKYAKVVSNIPFNISTDVVKQLLPMGDIFSEVVLLLQEETALRLVDASLRSSEYRPINIFVNFYSDPEYKFKVLRSNFFPQPNITGDRLMTGTNFTLFESLGTAVTRMKVRVDAAVVTFKLKEAAEYPPVASTKSFFSMVNSAFNGKRKMLRRSLQHICTSLEVERALESVGLPVTSRPEELTLDDFVRLHNLIVKG
ncbi:PREDICTED: ribosomal RNA small subunit methyltransferase, chloroplastic isoform X3 [Nelumbo nucifera]|uniref:rRNA adenine N(6)-methyltransferase n=1 Tax=Nelumbo nucifera TaxID=4432 RepID=A0A1U7ZTV1_NELNU|nr:PREDICTED: ribosomal RNA small subunit methyltransferase, chloroplastic isoform X3 [Nelumbo nucifera]